MTKLKTTKDARISYDKKTGAVRSFFGSELVSGESKQDTMEKSAADQFFDENKDILNFEKLTLKYDSVKKTNLFQTHRYHQTHNDIPVYGSHSQLTFRLKDKKIVANTNKVDYDLPENLNKKHVHINKDEALAYASECLTELFGKIEISNPKLCIYRHKEQEIQDPYRADDMRKNMLKRGKATIDKAYLVWQIQVDTQAPIGYWELLIDATGKSLLSVKDRRRFATCTGKVFWPDPITSSQDTSLSWNTPLSVLNKELVEVTIDHLVPPVNGKYSLHGSWVTCVDREPPSLAPPTTTTTFDYNAKDPRLLNVMAYYYLDCLITCLRDFGVTEFNNATATPIEVDAQGFNGDDNSHFVVYLNEKPYIAWGEGGIPDASDPGVIYHEYGHALHHFLLDDSSTNSSYEEGFNDFLSCCFRDRFNEHQFERANVFPWDNCQAIFWSDYRRCDLTERFDDMEFPDYSFYKKGNVYASALWDIYLNIGGNSKDADQRLQAADEMLHMYMETLLLVGDNEPADDLAQGLIQVDEAKTGGEYKQAIHDAFRNRGLWE